MYSEGACHVCLEQEEPSERPYAQETVWEKFKGSFGPMHLMRKN